VLLRPGLRWLRLPAVLAQDDIDMRASQARTLPLVASTVAYRSNHTNGIAELTQKVAEY
jgi:hypothetical protein